MRALVSPPRLPALSSGFHAPHEPRNSPSALLGIRITDPIVIIQNHAQKCTFCAELLGPMNAGPANAQESQEMDKQSSWIEIKSDPYQPLTDVVKS